MSGNVMHSRAEFFDLLTAHSERLVAGAEATRRLITGLGTHADDGAGLIDEVNVNETSADGIKAALVKMLFASVSTPISRDQLHTLISDLDRTIDSLQSVANNVIIYGVSESTPAARTLSSVAADACCQVNVAVGALADRDAAVMILEACGKIDAIESEASSVARVAVTRLFVQEGDDLAALHAIRMKHFHCRQAAVLHCCRRVARTIEEILLENA